MFGGYVEGRNYVIPKYSDILYGISTVDNYNVYSDPQLDIKTNLVHFMDVLDEAKKKFNVATTFSLLSTWFVFGSQDHLPVTEASHCNPRGFYSVTALAREQLLESYCKTFGLTFRIFRLANVLGVGDKKISKKKNALQFAVRQIVYNEPFELYWPNHTVRDYIHVDDACRAINLCLNIDLVDNQVVNIGNNIPIKFSDCIDYTVSKTGNNPVVHRERSKFHEIVQTDQMWLENTRIRLLGYKPEHSIYQTLDELIEYYTEEKNAGN